MTGSELRAQYLASLNYQEELAWTPPARPRHWWQLDESESELRRPEWLLASRERAQRSQLVRWQLGGSFDD